VKALVAAPRAREPFDTTAWTKLDDAALEERLAELLRNSTPGSWESALAALGTTSRHPVVRHRLLFDLLQRAGADFDASQPLASNTRAASAAIAELLARARKFEQSGSNGRPSPPAQNAVDMYRAALALDPANAVARAALDKLVADFVNAARTAAAKGNAGRARQILDRARALDPESVTVTAEAAKIGATP
jgi:hypothetical protein